MKANHGPDSGADRWTASGYVYDYLSNDFYPNERLMDLGNADWQNYWYETLMDDLWGGAKGQDHTGSDGIFADNTGYHVIWSDHWFDENYPGDSDCSDEPQDYYHDGAYDDDAWKADMNAFFGTACAVGETCRQGSCVGGDRDAGTHDTGLAEDATVEIDGGGSTADGSTRRGSDHWTAMSKTPATSKTTTRGYWRVRYHRRLPWPSLVSRSNVPVGGDGA
ncbi:MAG: hypothetical protein J7M25_10745 [Deltaproteobacteria bacterium]|nr:hypothetical protein [Deltaproteobacteria bacterium]